MPRLARMPKNNIATLRSCAKAAKPYNYVSVLAYTVMTFSNWLKVECIILPLEEGAKVNLIINNNSSSIISCSPSGASKLARTAAELARNESLQAHALSAEYRLDETGD